MSSILPLHHRVRFLPSYINCIGRSQFSGRAVAFQWHVEQSRLPCTLPEGAKLSLAECVRMLDNEHEVSWQPYSPEEPAPSSSVTALKLRAQSYVWHSLTVLTRAGGERHRVSGLRLSVLWERHYINVGVKINNYVRSNESVGVCLKVVFSVSTWWTTIKTFRWESGTSEMWFWHVGDRNAEEEVLETHYVTAWPARP